MGTQHDSTEKSLLGMFFEKKEKNRKKENQCFSWKIKKEKERKVKKTSGKKRKKKS
jgi:hypothetical protein